MYSKELHFLEGFGDTSNQNYVAAPQYRFRSRVLICGLDAVFFSVTTVVRKYRDDNEGQFYSCKCTRQLNAWAEKAARELKNVTPIIKYNKKY